MSQLKNLMNACPPLHELNAKMKLYDGEIHIDIFNARIPHEKKSSGVSSRQYEASENSLKILINDAFRMCSMVTK